MIKAVVGLGNPGKTYAGTRHNVGFEVIDELALRNHLTFKRGWRIRGRSCMMRGHEGPVLLVKPSTFMNESGRCVAAVRRHMGFAPEEILIVVDDVDLPLGQIRLRSQGGAGGHNGLRSVTDGLSSQAFPRLRIGVGKRPDGEDLVEFVLSPFTPKERTAVDGSIRSAVDTVIAAIDHGLSHAMTTFNAASQES